MSDTNTQDVTIQRGSIRPEKRDVASDPQWLKDRVDSLKLKKVELNNRQNLIDSEIAKREAQLREITGEKVGEEI